MSRVLSCAEPDRADALAAAVGALRRGSLVVLPTDTVYGVAADAFTPTAVAALLAAKGRGRDVPVPVLVGSWRGLDGLAVSPPPPARALVEAFWPGGLTIVVKSSPTLAWDLGETRGTVALRMPLHPVALDVLTETGPLAVSSANRTGAPPATTVEQAHASLGDAVAVYLDGGPCAAPVASTVVDLSGGATVRPRVLRRGAVSVDALREVVPDLLDVGETEAGEEPDLLPERPDAGPAAPPEVGA